MGTVASPSTSVALQGVEGFTPKILLIADQYADGKCGRNQPMPAAPAIRDHLFAKRSTRHGALLFLDDLAFWQPAAGLRSPRTRRQRIDTHCSYHRPFRAQTALAQARGARSRNDDIRA